MTDRIPLRAWRMARRKAAIEVDGDVVAIYLPAYFGPHRWQVEAGRIAVAAIKSIVTAPGPPGMEFAERVAVPYIATASTVKPGNLVLMFDQPQVVPPLRAYLALANNLDLPFGVRSSRRGEGRLDGIVLRAVDPSSAAARIREAGAEATTDPDEWLRQHRILVPIPTEPAVVRRRQRARFLARLSYGGVLLGGATCTVCRFLPQANSWYDRLLFSGLGLFAASLAGTALVRRMV